MSEKFYTFELMNITKEMNSFSNTSDKTIKTISWKLKEELKELQDLKTEVKKLQSKLIESEQKLKELNNLLK